MATKHTRLRLRQLIISRINALGRLRSRSAKRRLGQSAWRVPVISGTLGSHHPTTKLRPGRYATPHLDALHNPRTSLPNHLSSSEFLVIAIPISSGTSIEISSQPPILWGLNPFRVRSPSSEGGMRLLLVACVVPISSVRRAVAISVNDQPFSPDAAFLRESISRVIMIGRKTSFPTAGRSWRLG